MTSPKIKASLEAIKDMLVENKDALEIVSNVRCTNVNCEGLECQQVECYILRIDYILKGGEDE